MCTCSKAVTTVIHGAVGLTKAAMGVGQVTEQTVKIRRDRCRECPQATRLNLPQFAAFKGLHKFSLCTTCKCFIGAKTLLASEKCPLAKW